MKRTILILLAASALFGFVFMIFSKGSASDQGRKTALINRPAHAPLPAVAPSPQYTPPSLAPAPQKNSIQSVTLPAGQAISVDGYIVCLPQKILTGVCTIGIETKDGKDYGLVDSNDQNLDAKSFTTGEAARISGVSKSEPRLEADYSITGTIMVQSVNRP